MGLQISESTNHTHKIFLLCNYILLGSASSCIFLTLSLRLFPSIVGFLFILLHIITICAAVSGCAASSSNMGGSHKWYAIHMVATVLTAIFQGSVAVLIFTTTSNFLGALKSYVREEDGAVILKLAGGLCILMFCLEWVVMSLAFVLKYHACLDGSRSGDVNGGGKEDDLKNWPWPLQV